jgi:hypothetical protein
VPQGANPEARVQCPLCDEEYLLAEALATAPPELILLDAPSPAAVAAGDSFAAWGDSGTSDIHGEALETEAAPSRPGFDFGGSGEDSQAVDRDDPSMPKMAPLPGPRRRRSSFMRQMIGVFGGGIIGLGLGYYILLWIGGPQKDFLKIGGKLPAFMVPPEFHGGGGDTAENPPAEPALPKPKESKKNDKDYEDTEGPDFAGLNEEKFGIKPVDPNAAPDGAGDGAAEPGTDPPAKSQSFVRGSPAYEPNELGAALKAAKETSADLAAGSLDDADQKAGMLKAFKNFCELAEKVTFVQGDSGGLDQLASRRSAATKIAREVAETAVSLDDLGKMADGWVRSANRTSSGVYLIGDVKNIKQAEGEAGAEGPFQSVILPAGQSSEVMVVTPKAPPWDLLDQIVVLGSIVEDPASNIEGFEGDQPQAVWAGISIRLDPQ